MSKLSFSNLILQNPLLYWSYQRLVGGDTARKSFIDDFVKPVSGEKILDIGCGPGNILDFLPEMNYYGFDIDESYIAAAKQNYGDRGQFTCNNMYNYNLLEPGTFDKVIATGIIHHIDDNETEQLFKIAHEALKQGGHFYSFDGCYIENQNIISKFLLKSDRGKHVRKQQEYERLAKTSFQIINSTINESYFHIPYTSIIMDCIKE